MANGCPLGVVATNAEVDILEPHAQILSVHGVLRWHDQALQVYVRG
jgi:hypothetical protein